MIPEEIKKRSLIAMNQLSDCLDEELKSKIDFDRRDLPAVFEGKSVRLVIIGQDPTLASKSSLRKITTVLDLNNRGKLRTFLEEICGMLELSLDDNVYATNVCKNYFSRPPTIIKSVDVLERSAFAWLPVLRYELDQFPNALVMGLGHRVLESVLVKTAHQHRMPYYWGITELSDIGPCTHIPAEHTNINRPVFPMVHLTTWRTQRVYRDPVRRKRYISYIKSFLPPISPE